MGIKLPEVLLKNNLFKDTLEEHDPQDCTLLNLSEADKTRDDEGNLNIEYRSVTLSNFRPGGPLICFHVLSSSRTSNFTP